MIPKTVVCCLKKVSPALETCQTPTKVEYKIQDRSTGPKGSVCDIQAACSVNGIMNRHMSQWSQNIVNGGHEVTRFLGVCPDLSWHDIVEGMDGLSGAEGIHTPNSHRYVVGQA